MLPLNYCFRAHLFCFVFFFFLWRGVGETRIETTQLWLSIPSPNVTNCSECPRPSAAIKIKSKQLWWMQFMLLRPLRLVNTKIKVLPDPNPFQDMKKMHLHQNNSHRFQKLLDLRRDFPRGYWFGLFQAQYEHLPPLETEPVDIQVNTTSFGLLRKQKANVPSSNKFPILCSITYLITCIGAISVEKNGSTSLIFIH